jgi:uracil-DNA glycosylase
MKNTLKMYNEFGVDAFYSEKPVDRTMKSPDKVIEATPTQATKQDIPSRQLADQCNTIQELEAAVKGYNGCSIKKMAINTVFADGKLDASIMMIGEAPGANEDKEGIPFCGQSGKLLNNILPSIGLKREDVYITNTMFWRPPGNRRPTPEELEMCRPFVEKHIALVNPKVIVLVGSTAVESLLGNKFSMHQIRSEYYDYTNPYLAKPIKTAVIFHPSYLLRQPSKKKLMWFDMLKLKTFLESQG